MKRKRRVLSALLALSLTLNTLPMEALAAEPGSITGSQIQRDAVDGQTQTEADKRLEEPTGPEEGVQAHIDTIQYDLGNGAVLDFDPGNGAVVKCAPGEATAIQIPSEINDISVTAIGANAFQDCDGLINITIPDSVSSIGDMAFSSCDGLADIIIPGSVASIGVGAFNFCSGLKHVTILEGVTSIADQMFEGCGELADIALPDSVTSIGSMAFYECGKLTEIALPGHVTSIGDSAFVRCVGLSSVTIPDGVVSIGNSIFNGCSGLTEINIPNSVASIESYVFVDCGLANVVLPDSLEFIGVSAFRRCRNLTGITIPDSVTLIDDTAFEECSALTIYCFPDSYAETYAQEHNIPYDLIGVRRMLNVVLWDESGKPLTEGFSVLWYDIDGNLLGTGSTLGDADLEETYTFDIMLGEELASRYEQPERQTIAPEDEATCSVQLVPKPVTPMLTLTGRVLNKDGQPLEGAVVTVVTADSDPVEAVTGQDGTFQVEVSYAMMQVTVQKDGYYSGRLLLDLSNETGDSYQMEDSVLGEVVTVSDRITLDITQKSAAENAEQAIETPVISAKAFAFTLTGNDGRAITDYEVQGSALFFKSGTVSANETIIVTMMDPAGVYTGSSAEVTLDGNCLGNAELTLTEKGSFLLGSLSGPEATLMVFDGSGKCVRTGKAEGGMSSGIMEAGNYRVALLQKSDLLRGVSHLDYLRILGLEAGRDYLLREITISDGNVIRLDDCVVPALDESAMSYVVAENTSVTTSKSAGAALGEQILVRAAYELDASKGVSAGDLSIVLPEGVMLADNSTALINGKQAAYTYDSARREVKLSMAGYSKATAYLYCYAAGSGSHSVSAYLTLGNGAIQPIGTATVRVETAKLNVVEQTAISEGLNAFGKTLPNSTVVLYDNDEEVGRTTSNVAGSWSMKFALAQPVYSYSYHFVQAVTETDGLSEPISTEESMITYNKDSAGQVIKITMYNIDDFGQQETVFDFTEAVSTVIPYYRMNPQNPTFTFKVEFAGDASKLSDVYVVTTNSAGDKTYIETTYDAIGNVWVGAHDYRSFNDAPVRVSTYNYDNVITSTPFDAEAYIELMTEMYQTNLDLAMEGQIEQTYKIVEEEMIVNFNEEEETGTISVPVAYTDEEGNVVIFGIYTVDVKNLSQEELSPEWLSEAGYYPVSLAADNDLWVSESKSDKITSSIVSISERTCWTETLESIQTNTFSKDSMRDFTDWFEYLPVVGGIATGTNNLFDWLEYSGEIESALKGNSELLAQRSAGMKKLLEHGYCSESDRQRFGEQLNSLENRTSEYLEDARRRCETNTTKYMLGKTADTLIAFFGGKLVWAVLKKVPKLGKKLKFFEECQKSAIADNTAVFEELKEELGKVPSSVIYKVINAVIETPEYLFDTAAGELATLVGGGASEFLKLFNSSGAVVQNLNTGYGKINNDYDALMESVVASCKADKFMERDGIGRLAVSILDPSGYVYEAVPSNRLEGVTAVVSCEAENGSAWDAAAYDQVNPQITGTDGIYYWDVPQGNWKVSFTKDGYEAANTEEVAKAAGYSDGWLPVPPPQLEINVGMISNAAPFVKQAVAYTDQVEVEFSQYMDINSVASALSLTQNGVNVSGCKIVPLDAEYNMENTVQYATRFAIVPDNAVLSDGLIVSVANTAQNYAGTPMGEGYISPSMAPSIRPTAIAAPDKVSVLLHEETGITVSLQPGIAGRKLTVESLSPAIVTVGSEEAATDQSGNAEILLTGILPGSGLVCVSDPESGLRKTISVQVGAVKDIPSDVTVEPVTAVLENGTVVTNGMTIPAGTKIWLETQTADAVIRYTLNDTCPCTADALTYSTPITIDDSTVLRAAAYKDNTYSTTIRLELRVEASGDIPPEPDHTHDWAAEWSSDGTHHWHECVADGCTITNNRDKDNYNEHSYDSEADVDCNICGFVRGAAGHIHNWDAAWQNNSTHHWHECTVPGCNVTEDSDKNGYGVHSYDDDADNECNVCGLIRDTDAPSGQRYTITFNANGGTVDTSTITTSADGKLGSLPEAVRDGYTFEGWYTAIDGGVLIAADTEFAQDTTVYAHWQQDSGDGYASPLTDGEDAPTGDAQAEKRLYTDILLYSLGILAIAAVLVYCKKKQR